MIQLIAGQRSAALSEEFFRPDVLDVLVPDLLLVPG